MTMQTPQFSLQGRTVLVTGAAQGIGRAIVDQVLVTGGNVVAVDLNTGKLQALLEKVGPGRLLLQEGSVADPALAEQAMAAGVRQFGGVEGLVNNAGITRPAMIDKMTAGEWQQVIDVHLSGSFYFLQAVGRHLIARAKAGEAHGGAIVNISSDAGRRGTIGQINYSAAKAAIAGMTKSAAKELGRHGITVNAIAPGAATPMTEVIRTDDRFKDKYLERIPLGRWAEPHEVAPAFVFLASDWASYITGQILAVDGGLTIR